MTIMPASSDVASTPTASNSADELMRIGDVARMFDVSLRTLRFYEDKGLIDPKREGMSRLYSRRDLTRLKLITLGTRVGFSLREIKQMMDLYNPEGSNMRQYRVVLEKSERQLARLEDQRRKLDEAIDELRETSGNVRALLEERQRDAA